MGLATGEWFQNAWFTRDQEPAPTLTSPLTAEPWQRAMAAAGYRATIVVRAQQEFADDTLRAAVTDSIGVRGLPAILVGVPTPHDVFLATQYDDQGNTLRGWAVTGGNTIRFDETEIRTLTEWQKQTHILVAPSMRITRAERRVVYRQALQRGLTMLREKEMGAFHAGPATYDAWQKALLDDSPAADEKSLHARRVAAIEPLIWDLAERRAWAQVCLDDIAAETPEHAAELRAASTAAKQIHDHMWKINELAGGKEPGDRALPKLHDADTRAAIADLLKKCQALDAEIAAHIEKSLNP